MGTIRPAASGPAVAQVRGPERNCAQPGCDTVLSVYNVTSYCALHERDEPAFRRNRFDGRKVVTRLCALKGCGQSFETPNPTRIYCSDRCRMLAFWLRKKRMGGNTDSGAS